VIFYVYTNHKYKLLTDTTMSEKDYKTFKWWLIGQAVVILAGALIWYGAINSTMSETTKDIEVLQRTKADKETVQAQLRGIEQKLDILIQLQKENK